MKEKPETRLTVVFCKRDAVSERVVYVRLGSIIDDRVNPFAAQEMVH